MTDTPWFRSDEALVDQLREQHSMQFAVPVVRGYRDLVPLQSGGQGAVFRAVDEQRGRRVALKVLHQQQFESPVDRRRFEREIFLVSRLKHPNVVRLYRFGETEDGRPFLAMEYVAGVSLADRVRERSLEEVLDLTLQIASALEHAHRRGVIHRDLKPENVMVDPDGNARLLDFGMAKPARSFRQNEGWELSATGQFSGSLRWASPEQVGGQPDDVDTRTDVYSLGLLLYYSLAERMPYGVDGSVADIVESIEHATPRPLNDAGRRVPPDVETIALRCLAKDRNRRYQSMGELADDLRCAIETEPIAARRDGPWYLMRSLLRAHPVASASVALALVSLIVFSAVTFRLYLRATNAEQSTQVALAGKRAETEKVAAVNEFLLGAFLGPRTGAGEGVQLDELLTSAAKRLESDPQLAEQPDVRADLHTAFAFWFSVLPERWSEAIGHADEALALYDAEAQPALTQLGWALEVRGEVRLKQGDYRAARRDLVAAWDVYRSAGLDDLNVARVGGHIASCAFALNELTELGPYLRDSERIVVRLFGSEDPRAVALSNALSEWERRLNGR